MNKKKYAYIYFMSNQYNTAFYIGVTSDLKRRVYEHKNKILKGHTFKYNLNKVLYFEKYNSITDAIEREKQIKNFKREWKIKLIKENNPLMIDLYDWIQEIDNGLNIHLKVINDKNKVYKIPYYAIADQVRNDESESKFRQIKIQCPAKINLTLKIINKRDDGFHNIESVMQTISLYDYITISVEEASKYNIELSGTSDEIPYNEKNLVYKAVMLFIERTNVHSCSIKIFIEKNIPVSAGLAGGSTDAAGTLYGLNKLFNEPLSKYELHELCAKLGSDLNFCLEGGRKMTKDRGEVIEPLEFKDFNVSLIKPKSLGISAKEAYTKFAQKNANNVSGRENYKNDLEWAVIDDYEELLQIKKLYPEAVMSGSGSVYFGVNMEFMPQKGYWIKNNLKAIENGITAV